MAASRVDFEEAQGTQRLWPLVVDDERLVRSVRRGEKLAFDVLYERHSHELFVFCRRLLGSSHDAEEALQGTFAKAHRALLADARPIEVRPWLYAIARNNCLSILRARRPGGESVPDPAKAVEVVAAAHGDPVIHAEQRQEVRELLGNVIELPQRQRDALVLAELHGMRHVDVGEAMGVRPEQVKAYVHQARANLIAERDARATDCVAIRRELDACGGSTRRARIRRHVRSCPSCRAHAQRLRGGDRGAAAFLPLGVLVGLRHKLLALLLSRHAATTAPDSATAVGTQVAEIGGGGGFAMAAKVLAGLALLGAGAKVGTAVVEHGRPAPAAAAAGAASSGGEAAGSGASGLIRALRGAGLRGSAEGGGGSGFSGSGHGGKPPKLPGGGGSGAAGSGGSTPAAGTSPTYTVRAGGEGPAASSEAPRGQSQLPRGKSEVPHGKGEAPRSTSKEPHGRSEEQQGASEEEHGASEQPHGRSEEQHGASEEAHGRSEEQHGASEEAHGRPEETSGKSEEPHGRSEEAPGHSEEPHGRSAEAKATELHGKSEEAPGHSEEARDRTEEPHGKSEEPHGKP